MGYTGKNTIIVSVEKIISTSAKIHSYDSSASLALWRNNRVTLKGRDIVVEGTSFGMVDASFKGTIGASQVMATNWTSDSHLQCKKSTGMGKNHGITVTVATQRLTFSSIFSFDAPMISEISSRNSPTSGGVVILVSGYNLGVYDSTPFVQVGEFRCARSNWVSDSSLACTMAEGSGIDHLVTSHVDGTSSRADVRFVLGFNNPKVLASTIRLVSNAVRGSSVTGDPLRFGHDLIEFLGTDFGNSFNDNVTITYGHFDGFGINSSAVYKCDLNGTGAFTLHTVARCFTDRTGSERNLTFHIRVNNQQTNGSDFYSYAPTIATESLFLNSKRGRVALSMLGGDSVHFKGRNLGNRWDNMKLIYYHPSTRNINFSCQIDFLRSNSTH